MEFRPLEPIRYEKENELQEAASNVNPNYRQVATAAYILPKIVDPLNPQPFRAGSPYQQLIDTRVVHDHLLTRFRGSSKQTSAGGKKVLCYLTNWSFYRSKDGKFVPENLDPKLCTHIIYSFGSLDPTLLTVKEFDKWVDIDNDLYRRATSLSKDIPVLLAIGGWTGTYKKMNKIFLRI